MEEVHRAGTVHTTILHVVAVSSVRCVGAKARTAHEAHSDVVVQGRMKDEWPSSLGP